MLPNSIMLMGIKKRIIVTLNFGKYVKKRGYKLKFKIILAWKLKQRAKINYAFSGEHRGNMNLPQ